jgi:hypothetical protein
MMLSELLDISMKSSLMLIAGNLNKRKKNGASLKNKDIRKYVLKSVHDKMRPVIACLSVTGDQWMPEWSIITEYDDSGDVITGWSCFQARATNMRTFNNLTLRARC